MQWRVKRSNLSGTIAVPPSKSHTIRALLVASLAHGKSVVRNALVEGDGASALRVAQSLGALVSRDGTTVYITGVGGRPDAGELVCDCGNSGTSMTLFTSAAALGNVSRRFDGDSSLRRRPMRPLFDALGPLGVTIDSNGNTGDVPFTVGGPLAGGITTVNGISSQFVSSLLLSCPLARGNTTIHVTNLQERPYVEITLGWLDKMEIRHEKSDDLTTFEIPGGQSYSPVDLAIPGDFSSATFGAVAAAASAATLRLDGIDFSDPQGDKAVFSIIERFGARVERSAAGAVVSGSGLLQGCEIDLNANPDALPALCVLACASRGVTRLVNVHQARIKETDRIAVMTQELSRMGARITELPDGIEIEGGSLHGAAVSGHDDHRVVMALALAGMIAEGETVIDTAESATVTYAGFVDDFRALGADIVVVS